MDIYAALAKVYDLLDVIYFRETGKNPREVIEHWIPNENKKLMDLCCGTLSNTLTIAKKNSALNVIGLDLSKDMLRVAKKKAKQQGLKNVRFKCADATNTGFKDESFDYLILGLVLHENTPSLDDALLKEANRLLKEDGRLIVLEWAPPNKLYQLIKFAPLYLVETLSCKTFRKFYEADKEVYFRHHGFEVVEQELCNYSIVLNLKKASISKE